MGGWAVAAHGHARTTNDLDIFIRADEANASRIYAALVSFGAPVAAHGITETTFATAGTQYLFGVPPHRIDVLTTIGGIGFDEAFGSSKPYQFGPCVVPMVGLEALLRAERAAGRHKDLTDLEALERLRDSPTGGGPVPE